MSTTYTYTKAVKNVTLLKSTIEKVFTKRIENYDYNSVTSEFSITFSAEITAEEKVALDVLVNTYVDSTILTPEDVTSFKNFRAYKTTDVVISSTLNSTTEIPFQSTSHIDRQYYQTSTSNKYVYIQKPGTYFITAKVGACLQQGGVAGTTTVIQWALSYDDIRSELAYIPIINGNVYTTHTNVNNITDCTIVNCVFTVNAVNGTNLRLTAKRILGTMPLVIDSDFTSLQIMSIPGASFYEGNISANVTLTTTAANINYGSDRLVQYPFTHTLGQPNVTITQPGDVVIFAKATFNKTAGTDASIGTIFARLNGTNITSLSAHTHELRALNNKTTIHFMGTIAVNVGDVISLQTQTVIGTSLQLPSTESGVILIYLQPQVIKNLTLGSFYSTGFSDAVSVSPIDITAVTTNILYPSIPPNITAATTLYTVSNAGLYLIVANLTFNNPTSIVKEGGVYITTSVDGKTFYVQPSSLSIKQIAANNKTTATTVCLLNLPANSKVKIHAASSGATTDDMRVVLDNSQINFLNFYDLAQEDGDGVMFGTKFNLISSPEDVLVSTVAYVEKCRLLNHSLEAGIYRVGTNATFSTTAQTVINIQLLDAHATSGNTYVVYTKTLDLPIGTHSHSSADFVNALDGSHVFILQLSSPNVIPYTVKNCGLETWRVQ